MDYFQRAPRMAEEDNDILAQADAEAGSGRRRDRLKDAPRARTHTERTLVLAEKAADFGRIALYASNLANSYFEAKDYERAPALYQRVDDFPSARSAHQRRRHPRGSRAHR